MIAADAVSATCTQVTQALTVIHESSHNVRNERSVLVPDLGVSFNMIISLSLALYSFYPVVNPSWLHFVLVINCYLSAHSYEELRTNRIGGPRGCMHGSRMETGSDIRISN